MNPIFLLALGAVAVLAFAGKKSEKKNGSKTDDTGTIPKRGDKPPGPAQTEEDAIDEEEFVNVAVNGTLQEEWGPYYFLGQDGIDQAVLGIDEDGFVTATPGEWLSGWLTRVAYWGAYQMKGWPLELPVTCVMEMTCPEEMLPVREAMLRINAMVLDQMAEAGVDDVRL